MIRRLLILCALCGLGVNARAQVDVDRMVEALGMKETGIAWSGRPGPCGELSRYQLTATVWRQHCLAPFAMAATDPDLARLVAERHVRWLIAQIRRAGLVVTPQRVATAWHFGISHAAERTRWGLEVAALYQDLLATRYSLPATAK